MSKRSKTITFPRVVAFMACGIFALMGSLVFLVKMFGSTVGGYPVPPAVTESHGELERTGVTTRAEPIFAIPRQGHERVSLLAKPTHETIERSDHTELGLAVGVKAWSDDDTVRAPVALSLVFDVSGSMEGQPLSDVKTAAINLLDQLEPEDQVSLVAYSSEARLIAPLTPVNEYTRSDLQATISGLRADGGTNISAGWELGHGQLVEAPHAATRRVVVLSDGQANEGIVDISTFASMTSRAMEQGVTTTAMGVGLDYNEDMMQAIARSGGGNYYFVHDTAPALAFDDELAMLKNAVSSRVQLRVKTTPQVPVARVEGFEWRERHDGSLEVELGALADGMRRDVLVEFQGVAHTEPVAMTAELVWYDDAGGSQKKSWAQTVSVGDEPIYNAEVLSRMRKIRTARALKEATTMYQSGQRESAARLLDRTVSANEQFVDLHDVDEDVFDRANEVLEDLAHDIRSYDPSSQRGKYMIKGSKFKSANVAVDSSVTF
jgi:Ca-activated chloride channel family protein